ncbi:hypothetical protein T07_7273 [Trichinella nelsoni]|uniref:Uncharacterized protein n=1 Tax=Trichinella nelsoni TaxID=6336 RepID=A0A0V0SHY6_9BILA|nr:hypothetical protein T07_7273 [Trichinella nelsoni]
MYLNYYCIVFVAFSTINFTTSMQQIRRHSSVDPTWPSSPLGQTVQYNNADLRVRRKVKEALFEWDKTQPFGYFKKLLEIKNKFHSKNITILYFTIRYPVYLLVFTSHLVNEQKLLQSTVCMPCIATSKESDCEMCAKTFSTCSGNGMLPQQREEVTIETQNIITKILFEWDRQHASGAQTVGIITTYDTTLVKKSCKVQAKYANVNDSCKVVSSPVKCKVQFVNNDLRQAEIIC